jgi:hypothetical protein
MFKYQVRAFEIPRVDRPHISIPLDTPQYLSIPLNTSRYLSIPLDTPQYPSIPLNTSQYLSIPLNTPQYLSIPLNTSRYPSIPLSTSQDLSRPLKTSQYLSVPLNTSRYHSMPLNTPRYLSIPLNTLDTSRYLRRSVLHRWCKIREAKYACRARNIVNLVFNGGRVSDQVNTPFMQRRCQVSDIWSESRRKQRAFVKAGATRPQGTRRCEKGQHGPFNASWDLVTWIPMSSPASRAHVPPCRHNNGQRGCSGPRRNCNHECVYKVECTDLIPFMHRTEGYRISRA